MLGIKDENFRFGEAMFDRKEETFRLKEAMFGLKEAISG
jgi:hypothetical protein